MATELSTKNKLIKKFYALLTQNGINKDQKEALLSGFGVTSTLDLSEQQLISICKELEKNTNKAADMWRKRVMAAIGAWLKSQHKTETCDYIKSIACRACNKNNFNKLTVAELRRVYSEFKKKNNTHKTVKLLKSKEIMYNTLMN